MAIERAVPVRRIGVAGCDIGDLAVIMARRDGMNGQRRAIAIDQRIAAGNKPIGPFQRARRNQHQLTGMDDDRPVDAEPDIDHQGRRTAGGTLRRGGESDRGRAPVHRARRIAHAVRGEHGIANRQPAKRGRSGRGGDLRSGVTTGAVARAGRDVPRLAQRPAFLQRQRLHGSGAGVAAFEQLEGGVPRGWHAPGYRPALPVGAPARHPERPVGLVVAGRGIARRKIGRGSDAIGRHIDVLLTGD